MYDCFKRITQNETYPKKSVDRASNNCAVDILRLIQKILKACKWFGHTNRRSFEDGCNPVFLKPHKYMNNKIAGFFLILELGAMP